jgi:four helix bundle protein
MNKTMTPPKPKATSPRSTDVSDRLRDFVSDMLGLAGTLPDDRAGNTLSDVILKHSVASYFRHAEAEGSPSAKDFANKFRECLGELRSLRKALTLLRGSGIVCSRLAIERGLEDCDILIRIFFSSVRTLEANQ